MDLGKVDEAVQSLHTLVTFKTEKNTMKDIPSADPKVVKSLVYTALKQLKEAREGALKDGETEDTRKAELGSKERTLVRVGELLGRISSVMKTQPWVWEVRSRRGANATSVAGGCNVPAANALHAQFLTPYHRSCTFFIMKALASLGNWL